MYSPEAPYTHDQLIIRNRQYTKDFLRKPFTLILAILIIFTEVSNSAISFLMWLSTMIMPAEEITLYLQDILGTDSIEFGGGSFDMSAPVGSIALIVAILILYIKSRNTDYRTSPTTGTVILKVYSTINLIAQTISSVLLILIPIIAGIILKEVQNNYNSYSAGLPDRIIGISVFLVTLYILFNVALNIINAVGLRNFSVSLHHSLTTEKLSHKGATLYAISNFIRLGETAVTTIAAAAILYNASDNLNAMTDGELSAIFEQMPFRAIGLLLLLALPVSALKNIILSLFALRYRRHIIDAGENACNLPPLVLPYNKVAESEASEETSVAGSPQTEASALQTENENNNPYAVLHKPTESPGSSSTAETERTESHNATPNFCCMCGTPVTPEHKFCAHCGNKLN